MARQNLLFLELCGRRDMPNYSLKRRIITPSPNVLKYHRQRVRKGCVVLYAQRTSKVIRMQLDLIG